MNRILPISLPQFNLKDKTKIGVAVVGLGVGVQHAKAYYRLDDCSLHWLYDLDSFKASEIASALGEVRVAHSFQQILEDKDVQIISIASYDSAHFEQIVASLKSGKHVFVEKPICHTLNELKTIKETWSQSQKKLKLSSNLVLRAAPLYQWLREKIKSGDSGEIYAFDGDYLYGRLHKITRGWRKTEENYSVMLGGGIHLIDLMLWLTNEKPLTVQAVGNNICTQDTNFNYNDYVSALLTFPNGLIGRITANFGCVHQHQHVIRIFGTHATFIYDDSGPRLHQTRDPMLSASQVHYSALSETKGDLIPPFVDAVIRDIDWDQHTQNMFDVISVCLACEAAVTSNSLQEIEYI